MREPDQYSLRQSNRATEVGELRRHLGGNIGERLNCRSDYTIEVARDGLGRQLIQQAGSLRWTDASTDGTVLDSAEVDSIE